MDRHEILRILDEEVEKVVFGKWADSYNIDKISWLSACVSASDFAGAHMKKTPRFASSVALLQECLRLTPTNGLLLEFGVYSGETINLIAQQIPDRQVFGFDSFEGLPEAWREGYAKGQFALETLPKVPSNVSLIVGWFNLTLPNFVASYRDEKIAFLHVDCDLYSSTVTILSEMRQMIVPGTIILFDEFFNYPGWQFHEAKAFEEFCQAYDVQFEFIGLVPHHQQVAVRVLSR